MVHRLALIAPIISYSAYSTYDAVPFCHTWAYPSTATSSATFSRYLCVHDSNDLYNNIMSYYTTYFETSIYTSRVNGQDKLFTSSWVSLTITDADPMVTLAKDGVVLRSTTTSANSSTLPDSSPTQMSTMTSDLHSSTSLPSSTGTQLSGGQIAAIVIGGLVFLLICAFGLVMYLLSKKGRYQWRRWIGSGHGRTTSLKRDFGKEAVDWDRYGDVSSQNGARTRTELSTLPSGGI